MARSTSTLGTMRAVSAVLFLTVAGLVAAGVDQYEALGHIDRVEANSMGAYPASNTSKLYPPGKVQSQKD